MGQYSPRTLLRNVSNHLLRRYFDANQIRSTLPWENLNERDVDSLMEVLASQDPAKRAAVEGDFTLVSELAHAGGSSLIYEEASYSGAGWGDRLDEMTNDWERAFLVLLEDRRLLDRLIDCNEMDRFADSRWWRRFVGEHLDAADDDEAIGALRREMHEIFRKQGRGRRCHIELLERRDPERFCYFAYPEDHAKTDLGYDEQSRFGRQTRRTATEVIFVYRPDDGLLEMAAKGDRRHKERLAGAFCQSILGLTELPGADQRPPYDLSVLMQRGFVFPTAPEANVERVEVRQLRFDLPGPGSRRLIVSARPAADGRHGLHDLIDEAVNQTAFPVDTLRVSQAKISMRFHSENGRRGKILTFDVTYPDRCNLKDYGHDAIAKECLVQWGIARG